MTTTSTNTPTTINTTSTTINTTTTTDQIQTTTSTNLLTTTTSSPVTTTTTLPGSTCNLFADDFNDGDVSDWVFDDVALWIVNGELQVTNIGGDLASACHVLPFPHFFRLSVDLEAKDFDGSFYGFQAFSDTQEFTVGGRTLDGLGASGWRDPADGLLKAAFLGYDVLADVWVHFNAEYYGAVQTLGIEWRSSGVTLLVNGTPRSTLAAEAFGQTTLIPPSLGELGLFATGSAATIRFDNVCQSTVSAIQSGRVYGDTPRRSLANTTPNGGVRY